MKAGFNRGTAQDCALRLTKNGLVEYARHKARTTHLTAKGLTYLLEHQ